MPPDYTPRSSHPPSSHSSLLLLTSEQWVLAVVCGMISAAATLPFYKDISPWIGVAVFLIGVIIVHFRYACRIIVPFPHFMLLIVALQYVLAPWASFYYPSIDPLCDIGLRR